MTKELIISNLEQLPELYQEELLDFSEFLLFKVNQKNTNKKETRGGFGSRRGDYIMTEDFDYSNDIPLKASAEFMLNEYLQNPEMSALNILDGEDFYETK